MKKILTFFCLFFAGITLSAQNSLTITVKDVSFKMIRVQSGTFTMGNDLIFESVNPTHKVTLSTYYIGETEVTQGLWKAVIGDNPSEFRGNNLPVERVSYEDCQEFIRRLNQLTGKKFRLPTEAEWEFAVRGGTKSQGYIYCGDNDLNAVAWRKENAYIYDSDGLHFSTKDAKTKKPNELGIYDMTGNVSEWCSEWSEKLTKSTQSNPQGPSQGSKHVVRGCSWNTDLNRPCFNACRFHANPDVRSEEIGLRLVLVP